MAEVRNLTTGMSLASSAGLATSVWARFRGLMLRAPLRPGEGLLIEPCGSIHMMFMRFAIDAVFLDREQRVTKVARNVRPWLGFSFGGRGAHSVLECPAGAAAGTEPGHMIAVTPDPFRRRSQGTAAPPDRRPPDRARS